MEVLRRIRLINIFASVIAALHTALFVFPLSPSLVFALCMSGPSRQRVLPGPGCPGDQVSHRQPKTMETL